MNASQRRKLNQLADDIRDLATTLETHPGFDDKEGLNLSRQTFALANRVLELGHEIDNREWTIKKTIMDAFKQRGGAA